MAIPIRREPGSGSSAARDRALASASAPRTSRWGIATEVAFTLLRVVAGAMLIQHGVQKHFGLLLPPERHFAGGPAFLTQPWIAGTLEIGGGSLVALGLLTRPAAFLLSGMLAVAYFQVHAPRGFFPVLNQGELAALYSFVFLYFAAAGGGRFSVDALLGRTFGRTAL